ncbi:MAG: NADH dehydrogenase [Desulfobulbaceae bacterium DB1]|nr:MAG: NADH dehydrogenase [Desulfobulbaceae bacterium DB1]
MEQQSLLDLLYIAAFTLCGLGFGFGPLLIVYFFAPRGTRQIVNKTRIPIECGMLTIGPAWIRYGILYYLYALMFLAFDVDVLFLFPVAAVYNDFPGMRGFVEIVLFVGILSLAIVYAWNKGVFKWERKVYQQ